MGIDGLLYRCFGPNLHSFYLMLKPRAPKYGPLSLRSSSCLLHTLYVAFKGPFLCSTWVFKVASRDPGFSKAANFCLGASLEHIKDLGF